MESGDARVECGSTRVKSGWLARMLREALGAVREAAIRHREFVHRAYKLKIESLPPRLGRDTARTGQWVGLIEYSDGRECIQVVIEPKYGDFHRVYEEVVSTSPRIAESLALAVAGLHLGSIGRMHSLNIALWILDEYASKNPPYRVAEERYTLPLLPASVAPVVRRIMHNEKYYATLAVSMAVISRALAQPSGLPQSPLIDSMARIYTGWQRRLTTYIASRPQVAEALRGPWREEPELDTILEALAAIQRPPSPQGAGQARMMLTPAPKVYEVYVLLKTLEALSMRHGRLRSRSLRWFRVESPSRTVNVYYNRPPPEASRLVYRVTGSRPHPDILLEYSTGTRIVVDAKYRLGLALSGRAGAGRRLELKEALRLLGYLADLAHDGALRAVLAVPSKTEESASLAAALDGIGIQIDVAEVNPRVGPRDLAQLLP